MISRGQLKRLYAIARDLGYTDKPTVQNVMRTTAGVESTALIPVGRYEAVEKRCATTRRRRTSPARSPTRPTLTKRSPATCSSSSGRRHTTTQMRRERARRERSSTGDH